MNTTSLKAFVIGPIGDREAPDGTASRVSYEEGVQVLEDVIIPACTAFGIDVVRADMISKAGEIPEQIFRQLRDCPIVIADLTGANPNVMYELGLRHTTGKLTIQIGERGRLPFDVASIRTIMFKRTDAGLVQARKDLAKSLGANIDTRGDPVTATRIWFESAEPKNFSAPEENTQSNDSLHPDNEEENDDSPGFLELLAEMEEGNQSLIQTMSAATAIAEDITNIYSDATENVHQADLRGGGAAARLILADRTAARLEDPVARLEVVAGDYEKTVQRIQPGLLYLLERLLKEPEQLAEVPDFPEQVRKLVDASNSNVEGAMAMRQTTLEVGKASRTLRRVSQRLATAFKKMADVSRQIASWGDLIDKFPSPPR